MIYLLHLVDRPVALHATDPAVDVDRMVEIDEVGHAMNLDPGDGLAALGAFTHQRQPRIILEHLVMAVHAGRAGRDVREPRFLNSAVAVSAINPQLAGMRR